MEAFYHAIFAIDVPDFDGVVPGAAGKHAVGGTEVEARNGTTMPTHDVDELSSFETPKVNVEGIVRASTYYVS